MVARIICTTLLLLISVTVPSCSLKCYKCDGSECSSADNDLTVEECGNEKPICAQFIDLTGQSTGKVGTVFKRSCGEGSSENKNPECKCLTPDWDECTCSEDLCNGHLPHCGIRNFGKSGEDIGCRK